MTAETRPATPPRYVERARSYATVIALFCILLAGCIADLVLSKQPLHILLWAAAVVVVCGIMTVATRVANEYRTITVTDDAITVGEHSLERSSIVTVERTVTPDLPVLGQRLREGMPKGVPGLTLRLADGAGVAVPTRRPDALATALRMNIATEGVRAFEPDDRAALQDIERRVRVLYRVAGHELPEQYVCVAQLDAAATVLVCGRPAAGFVRIDDIDATAHLVALAVDPPHIGSGLGTRLLEAAVDWARAQGYAAMTASAFADVSWNAPFLRAHGFEPLDELTSGLEELRHWERTVGLDAVGARLVLRRTL